MLSISPGDRKPQRYFLPTHRQSTLPAVEAVLVNRHVDADAAPLAGARLSKTLHLAFVIDAVELQHGQLYRLVHVLHLLGLGVRLLLTLLTSTAKAQHLDVTNN